MKNLTKHLLLPISLGTVLSFAFFVGEAAALPPPPPRTPTPTPTYACITSGGQCTAASVACKSLGSYVWGGYGSPFCPASNPQCCIPIPTPTPTPVPTCSSLGGNCIASGFCTGTGKVTAATGCNVGTVCCVFPSPLSTPSCIANGGSCIPSYPCNLGYDQSTLSCGGSNVCCIPIPTPTSTYPCITSQGQCTAASVACKSLGSYVWGGYGSPFCPASNPQCCVPAPTPTSAALKTPQLVWKQIAACSAPQAAACTPVNSGCGGGIPPCCAGLVCDSTTTFQCIAPTPPQGARISVPTPTSVTPVPTLPPLPGYTDCAIRLYGENFCQGSNSLGPRQGCRKDLKAEACFDQPTGSLYESFKFVDCTPCNPFAPTPTPTPTISPLDICRAECDSLDQDGETTFRCYQRCRSILPTPPSITPTPLPGSIQLTLALAQQGLTNIPVNRNRTITVVLQGADDQIVTKTASVDYSNGTFKGTVNLGILPSGSYKLIVKAGKFLRTPISNLVISGAAASAQITLAAGLVSDQNNDNIDVISFYANGLRTCFGSTLGIKKCDNPEDVDLNGDANVDAIDYQIYLRGIRNLRQGLPVQ